MRIIHLSILLGGLLVVGTLVCAEFLLAGPPRLAVCLMAGTSCAVLLGILAVIHFDEDESADPPDHLEHVKAMARQDKLATLGLLGASVGHEVRNVISVVKMRLYLARQQVDDDLADELKSIGESITRLEDLAEHLAPYPDSDEQSSEGFAIREAIEGALDVVEMKIDDGVELEIDFDADLELPGSCGTFTQILVNLLLNACDAVRTRNDGRIALRATRHGDRAIVTVIDNGCGLPADQTDRIFDPFYSTKGDEREGGTGIGLWLCRKLVEQRGGAIRAENRDSGGARFTLDLPTQSTDPPLDRAPTDAREFPQQCDEDARLVSAHSSDDPTPEPPTGSRRSK